MLPEKTDANSTMQTIQPILKEHQILIQKTFNTYCLQHNIHLSSPARTLLFKKLLHYLQKSWSKRIEQYGYQIPESSLMVEMLRQGCKILFRNNNTEDIALLHSETTQLVLKYQPMIKHIVYKQLVKNGQQDSNLQEDLIANIQAKLLQKIKSGKLASQYKGDSLFSTYLYRIIYYNMIDEFRKINKHQTDSLIDNSDSSSKKEQTVSAVNMEHIDLIERHIRRFQTLLKMMPSKRQKRFEFALQIVYRMKITTLDIKALYAQCSETLLVEILSCFGKRYHDLIQAQLFILIADFLSLLEGGNRQVNSDSFRIWFQNVLKKVKGTLFEDLPKKDKKTMDAYFEWLIYKFYRKT